MPIFKDDGIRTKEVIFSFSGTFTRGVETNYFQVEGFPRELWNGIADTPPTTPATIGLRFGGEIDGVGVILEGSNARAWVVNCIRGSDDSFVYTSEEWRDNALESIQDTVWNHPSTGNFTVTPRGTFTASERVVNGITEHLIIFSSDESAQFIDSSPPIYNSVFGNSTTGLQIQNALVTTANGYNLVGDNTKIDLLGDAITSRVTSTVMQNGFRMTFATVPTGNGAIFDILEEGGARFSKFSGVANTVTQAAQLFPLFRRLQGTPTQMGFQDIDGNENSTMRNWNLFVAGNDTVTKLHDAIAVWIDGGDVQDDQGIVNPTLGGWAMTSISQGSVGVDVYATDINTNLAVPTVVNANNPVFTSISRSVTGTVTTTLSLAADPNREAIGNGLGVRFVSTAVRSNTTSGLTGQLPMISFEDNSSLLLDDSFILNISDGYDFHGDGKGVTVTVRDNSVLFFDGEHRDDLWGQKRGWTGTGVGDLVPYLAYERTVGNPFNVNIENGGAITQGEVRTEHINTGIRRNRFMGDKDGQGAAPGIYWNTNNGASPEFSSNFSNDTSFFPLPGVNLGRTLTIDHPGNGSAVYQVIPNVKNFDGETIIHNRGTFNLSDGGSLPLINADEDYTIDMYVGMNFDVSGDAVTGAGGFRPRGTKMIFGDYILNGVVHAGDFQWTASENTLNPALNNQGWVRLFRLYNPSFTYNGNALLDAYESYYTGTGATESSLQVIKEAVEEGTTIGTVGDQQHPWAAGVMVGNTLGLADTHLNGVNNYASGDGWGSTVNARDGLGLSFLVGQPATNDNQPNITDWFVYNRRDGFRPAFTTKSFADSLDSYQDGQELVTRLDPYWQGTTTAELDALITTALSVVAPVYTLAGNKIVVKFSGDHNDFYRRLEAYENIGSILGAGISDETRATHADGTNARFHRFIDKDVQVTPTSLMNISDYNVGWELLGNTNRSTALNGILGYELGNSTLEINSTAKHNLEVTLRCGAITVIGSGFNFVNSDVITSAAYTNNDDIDSTTFITPVFTTTGDVKNVSNITTTGNTTANDVSDSVLTVGGDATVNNVSGSVLNVDVDTAANDISSSTINVTGDVTANDVSSDSALNVTGNVTSSDVSDSALNVTGDANTSDVSNSTVDVAGDFTASDVSNSTLNVTGDATVTATDGTAFDVKGKLVATSMANATGSISLDLTSPTVDASVLTADSLTATTSVTGGSVITLENGFTVGVLNGSTINFKDGTGTVSGDSTSGFINSTGSSVHSLNVAGNCQSCEITGDNLDVNINSAVFNNGSVGTADNPVNDCDFSLATDLVNGADVFSKGSVTLSDNVNSAFVKASGVGSSITQPSGATVNSELDALANITLGGTSTNNTLNAGVTLATQLVIGGSMSGTTITNTGAGGVSTANCNTYISTGSWNNGTITAGVKATLINFLGNTAQLISQGNADISDAQTGFITLNGANQTSTITTLTGTALTQVATHTTNITNANGGRVTGGTVNVGFEGQLNGTIFNGVNLTDVKSNRDILVDQDVTFEGTGNTMSLTDDTGTKDVIFSGESSGTVRITNGPATPIQFQPGGVVATIDVDDGTNNTDNIILAENKFTLTFTFPEDPSGRGQVHNGRTGEIFNIITGTDRSMLVTEVSAKLGDVLTLTFNGLNSKTTIQTYTIPLTIFDGEEVSIDIIGVPEAHPGNAITIPSSLTLTTAGITYDTVNQHLVLDCNNVVENDLIMNEFIVQSLATNTVIHTAMRDLGSANFVGSHSSGTFYANTDIFKLTSATARSTSGVAPFIDKETVPYFEVLNAANPSEIPSKLELITSLDRDLGFTRNKVLASAEDIGAVTSAELSPSINGIATGVERSSIGPIPPNSIPRLNS